MKNIIENREAGVYGPSEDDVSNGGWADIYPGISVEQALAIVPTEEDFKSSAIIDSFLPLTTRERFQPVAEKALLVMGIFSLAGGVGYIVYDSATHPTTAQADELLKPPVFPGLNGHNVAIMPFAKAGSAYVVTSETGLGFYNAELGVNVQDSDIGVMIGGKVKTIIVADFDGQALGVENLGCGDGPSIDVIRNVGGNNYDERARKAMDILREEMKRVDAPETYSMVGMILPKTILQTSSSPDLIGGSVDQGNRSMTEGCGTPVAPAPQPEQPVTTGICGEGMQIADLRGKAILGVTGVPSKATGSFDLADHAPFRSVSGLEALKNVLGEPGAFLADPNNISGADKASWDAKVVAGYAEYIRRSGPAINFFDLQSKNDYGVSFNQTTGLYEFNLALPPHVIVRIDAEEAKIFMASANGDRNIRFEMCQSGATRGVDLGHQTLFIRSPYAQPSSLRLESPTIPGTQIQIFGMQVKNPTAFASAESFLQGVAARQGRADYPEYFVHALNMNDLTLGSSESPTPGASFQVVGKNY